MKSLQPVNQNVLLESVEQEIEAKTASGIIIPKAAVEKQNIAKVVGIAIIDHVEIAMGDTVLYKPFSGQETILEGKKYLLIPYTDILAKIVENEAI